MYRKWAASLNVALLTLLAVSAWAGERVAVMDFENQSPYGGWRVGQGAADILTTALVKSTDLEVFERSRLANIIKEQNLGTSGRINEATAARIGKIIGVKYIVTGAVTEYGQSRQGGGGGGVDVGRTGYSAAVDVRIVDAETGRIVFADSGEGSKASVNVRVFGIGGGEKFNEKHATEALREAIKQVSQKISHSGLSKGKGGGDSYSADPVPSSILVADVSGNIITLNKGSESGLKSGQKLTIKRKGKEIKDPATGKVLKVRYETIGQIKLSSVENGYSEGTVTNGNGFAVGDIAE